MAEVENGALRGPRRVQRMLKEMWKYYVEPKMRNFP